MDYYKGDKIMKRAILELTDHLLVEFLKKGLNKDRSITSVIENGLPDDVEVVRVGVKGNTGNNYGYTETGVLRLLLQSEEFPENVQGCEYPVLPCVVIHLQQLEKAVKWNDQQPFESGDYWCWYDTDKDPTIQYWDGKQFNVNMHPLYWAAIQYPTLELDKPLTLSPVQEITDIEVNGESVGKKTWGKSPLYAVKEILKVEDNFEDLDDDKEGIIPLKDLKGGDNV